MASGYLNETVKNKQTQTEINSYAAKSTVETRDSLSSPARILLTTPCSVMAPTPGSALISCCPEFPISYIRRSGVGSGKQ